MNDEYNEWGIVNKYKLEKVIDLVITNATIDNINPDKHLFELLGDSDKPLKVLDFGCGICRNAGYLSLTYPNWNIYGYDNENMLKHANDFCLKKYSLDVNRQKNLKLISNWNILKNEKFDVIFAVLVFQHIHEKYINLYLKDISNMTNKLIVFGRRFNDEYIVDDKNKIIYKNTWKIFENNGYYPSNINDIKYSFEGDPEEHTLCIYEL